MSLKSGTRTFHIGSKLLHPKKLLKANFSKDSSIMHTMKLDEFHKVFENLALQTCLSVIAKISNITQFTNQGGVKHMFSTFSTIFFQKSDF